MVQYLKIKTEYVDLINHLIGVFEEECSPELFAETLEDAVWVYTQALARSSETVEYFTKNEHVLNLHYLKGLALAFKQPKSNHFLGFAMDTCGNATKCNEMNAKKQIGDSLKAHVTASSNIVQDFKKQSDN